MEAKGLQSMKEWIDNASYEELLTKWRFAPIGDPFFTGEVGDYYTKVMKTHRDYMKSKQLSDASKKVGWEK